YEEFLCHVRGSKVRIRVPRRGSKRAFLETVTKNAEEAFSRHRLKRASDHNARARALTALQDALDLPEAPLRIECYDISHTMGTEIVASMVVMEDGLAKRFEEVYRPGESEPVRIPRDSEALYLLQAVRDEAHRFAITYHRSRRDKAMTRSILDDIAGLGPGRRKRLLKEFGSVRKIRA